VVIGLLAGACGGADAGGDASLPRDAGPPRPIEGWPDDNEFSWNGSWAPDSADFPIDGLLDDEYFDGHGGTPILPPGEWDWNDADDDLANWRNFSSNLGTFEMLESAAGQHYGWRFVANDEVPDFTGPAQYYEGTPGVDIVDLGPRGELHGYGSGSLGDGPDILVYERSYSLEFRTGSSETGAANDDDLVVGGCSETGATDIETSTMHTGPGSDWVFTRDIDRAAVDLGNGAGGRTDTLDPNDGDDLLVLRGTIHDTRLYGGFGNDVIVWYVDDTVQTTEWLGNNFFGGGGKGDALWDDPGVDRLVLVVPVDTVISDAPSTPEGALRVLPAERGFVEDEGTSADPFATYCIECGTAPDGRRTVIVEYRARGGEIFTGYCYTTGIEELQVGVGPGARVFQIDPVEGTIREDADARPTVPPTWPDELCR
jgi:hypothetical protein